jgi:hypothetical protein
LFVNISASGKTWILNCIARGTDDIMSSAQAGFYKDYTDAGTAYFINCLAFGFGDGYDVCGFRFGGWTTSSGTTYAYNCTSVRNQIGFWRHSAETVIIKNCIANDCTGSSPDPYYTNSGSWDSSGTNNVSDTGDAPASSPINGAVVFRDPTNSPYDFRIKASDGVARVAGANLYTDLIYPVVNDIEDHRRPQSGNFDCGIDQIYPQILRRRLENE